MAYDQQNYAEKSVYSSGFSVDTAPAEETAISAVNLALDRSNLLSVRVQQLADKLVGTAPQAVNAAGEGRSGPGAVFPALRATANQTRSLVEEALSALDRIERSLP